MRGRSRPPPIETRSDPRPHHGSRNGWGSATGLTLFAVDVDPRSRAEYEEIADMSIVLSVGTARRLEGER